MLEVRYTVANRTGTFVLGSGFLIPDLTEPAPFQITSKADLKNGEVFQNP